MNGGFRVQDSKKRGRQILNPEPWTLNPALCFLASVP
jgi:hypothetical protein